MSVCVKNNTTRAELWVHKSYEMTAVEVKGRDPNNTWEISGIHRSPNKDMWVLEKLAETRLDIQEELQCVASLEVI